MFDFFKEMQQKKILGNSNNVSELQNLYIASFSLQIIALFISIVFIIGLGFYWKKLQKGFQYVGDLVEKLQPKSKKTFDQ
jgi:ethanolamine transporter EutH